MSQRGTRSVAKPSQDGIALVLVLWVIALLAVIAGSFAFSARTHLQLTGNRVAQAAALAMADAGIHRGLYELARSQTDGDRWKANGTAHVFDLEGAQVTVTITSETAYIDLNTAPDRLLKGLLLSAELDEEAATRLLDAIIDWRDADELPRTAGAERDQYLAAGLNHVPTNKPFTDVEELRLVLGMTPKLFVRLAPALTVHSRQPGISSAISPKVVLMALPGVTEEEVDAYLAQRADLLENGQEPVPFPPAAGLAAVTDGRVYNLQSIARLPDGSLLSRQVIAKIANEPKQPFVIYRWRTD